jgi:gamma-tubulin complex component 2
MTEFRIHHLASRLIDLLGAGDASGPEVYVDILTRNMTRYVTTQVSTHNAKRKIAEFTSQHKEFLIKYDELKSKQIRELDALVYLISRIIDQPSVLSMLQAKCPNPIPQSEMTSLGEIPQSVASMVTPGTVISQSELDRLREQLASLTSSVNEAENAQAAERRRKKTGDTSNIPDDPKWKERPMLSSDFIVKREVTHQTSISVGSLPLEVQESAVVEDILFLLTGVEGKFILARPLKHKFSRRHFVVDSSLDISLQGLVQQLLPVCSHHSLVSRFIDSMSGYNNGLVRHAVTAAMRTLVKEELVLVAQLETIHRQGQLSLSRLWSYLQPVMRTMAILTTVVDGIVKGDCQGGQLLSLLHETATGFAGDVKAQEPCLYLTQQACVPYFNLLEQWIYKGIISDPYNEFFVEEHKQLEEHRVGDHYHNVYWEERYSVCRDRIPIFLEKVADKILRTGKYLNVIRECKRDVHCPAAREIVYTLHERESG